MGKARRNPRRSRVWPATAPYANLINHRTRPQTIAEEIRRRHGPDSDQAAFADAVVFWTRVYQPRQVPLNAARTLDDLVAQGLAIVHPPWDRTVHSRIAVRQIVAMFGLDETDLRTSLHRLHAARLLTVRPDGGLDLEHPPRRVHAAPQGGSHV